MRAVLAGQPLLITGEDGWIAVRIALACLDSSREGKVVRQP